MLAHRVHLVGTNETYLITQNQKPTFEKAMEGQGSAVVKIGDNTFRAREIKKITTVNVDLECCPPYFQKRVAAEKKNQSEPTLPAYRKLPTEWIILDPNGKILATDISRGTVDRIARNILARGDVEEDKTLRFIVAKCHYTLGSDNQKQYYTKLDQVEEAYKCFPYAELPSHMVVRQIYKYGVRQWKPTTN